ncbi:MAG: hypothetical protein HFI71_14190 [Lachnospiraceae bacterium]|nr:hypothetical protein [Lachnospiraceae bacterium]
MTRRVSCGMLGACMIGIGRCGAQSRENRRGVNYRSGAGNGLAGNSRRPPWSGLWPGDSVIVK